MLSPLEQYLYIVFESALFYFGDQLPKLKRLLF